MALRNPVIRTITAAFLTMHVLGALYNHIVAKNDVLRRMTIGLRAG